MYFPQNSLFNQNFNSIFVLNLEKSNQYVKFKLSVLSFHSMLVGKKLHNYIDVLNNLF